MQRYAFATYAVGATANVFAVADAMGHGDLKTTRIYQHPELGAIRDAIDQRNRRVRCESPHKIPHNQKQCPPFTEGSW